MQYIEDPIGLEFGKLVESPAAQIDPEGIDIGIEQSLQYRPAAVERHLAFGRVAAHQHRYPAAALGRIRCRFR